MHCMMTCISLGGCVVRSLLPQLQEQIFQLCSLRHKQWRAHGLLPISGTSLPAYRYLHRAFMQFRCYYMDGRYIRWVVGTYLSSLNFYDFHNKAIQII